MFLSPDRPAVAKLLAQANVFALSRHIDVAQARALVVASLAGQARMAAAVRGFDDVFLIAAAVCLLGIVPALFLRRASTTAAGGPIEA